MKPVFGHSYFAKLEKEVVADFADKKPEGCDSFRGVLRDTKGHAQESKRGNKTMNNPTEKIGFR